MTNLVSQARLTSRVQQIDVDSYGVPLLAGMTRTVEVGTGSRQLVGSLFSALVNVARPAMREAWR